MRSLSWQPCAQLKGRGFIIMKEQEKGYWGTGCHRSAGHGHLPTSLPCHQGERTGVQVSSDSLEIRRGLWSWESGWGN